VVASQLRTSGAVDGLAGSEPPEPSTRSIRPRRGLPGGRAVVGGLLVAVAAVGIFAAVSGAGKGPDTSYVVAARDVAPGSVLTAADLEVTAIELPDAVRGRAFRQPSDVVGAVVVGPLSEGELVQAGGLAPGEDAIVPTFSVAVAEADADGGELQRGDVVQVFATYGSDVAGTTVVVSPEATVVGISSGEDAVTSTGDLVVRLAVRSAEERSAIINATVTGKLSLVRVTGAEEPEATPRFRPEVDADTAAGDTPETTAPEDAEG